MPDIDGGHGFLTTFLPLNTEPCRRADGTITSPVHAIRELLATLPTSQHSPACAASSQQSPFATSPTTHLARFAVIDQPAYNGHDPTDAILSALPGAKDPLEAQPVDALPRPYLMFCAEFDAPKLGTADEILRDYLDDLCVRTPELWTAVLAHCFEAPSRPTADQAADYILGCRVETTMPFNDYGVEAATAGAPPIFVPLILCAVAFGGALLVAHLAAPWVFAIPVAAVIAIAVLGVAVWVLGARQSPWAPGQDLATALKSLHVQAAFTRFAQDHLADDPAALQAAFRNFVGQVRPSDLAGPTQAPGIVP